MPESIPIHFGLNGEPDGWGNKNTIFLLPAIGWVIFGIMLVIVYVPGISKYNYPLRVKPENKEKLAAISVRAIRVTMLTMAILFSMLAIEIYLIAMDYSNPPGAWYMVLSLFVVIGPISYYIIEALRLD